MKALFKPRKSLAFRGGLMCCTALIASGAAMAQTTAPTGARGSLSAEAGDPEATIIVTGTREVGRKAIDSPTSIEVLGADALEKTGQTNLLDALKDVLPSMSSTFVQGTPFRAFSLRSLAPGETLILIDGKRRHLSSQLFKNATPYQGSDPVDMDMIPLSAIDHIEYLRDGAAAQYGTDAIAGVINIILKHSDEGGQVSALGGFNWAGDGGTGQVGGEAGFTLGDDGFIDISADYHHHDFTNRSGLDPRTNSLIRERASGDPLTDVTDFGYNAEKPLGDEIAFYSFGTFGHRFAETNQAYRLPSIAPKVFPSGFTPYRADFENDFDIAAGLKGKGLGGWDWDLSTDYGRDLFHSDTDNSFNPTLFANGGPAQTKFYNGTFMSSSLTTNLDLRKDWMTGLWAAPINLAIGAEHRYETYQIKPGELDSYIYGGGQGSAGFSPQSASNSSRNVLGAYIDFSTHFTPNWQVDIAGRYESYDDVGAGETGKISTRYDFSPAFGLRGAIDNGYHAPTLAQEHFASTSMAPTSGSAQLPVESAAAKSLGVPSLQSENSVDYSLGVVAEPIEKLHVTLDAYQIDMGNRIIDTGALFGPLARTALAAQGLAIPFGVPAANFSANVFVNGVNTQTRGLDLDADYRSDLGAVGTVKWTLAGNYNTTKITEYKDAPGALRAAGVSLFNPTSISFLTTAVPKTKVSLAATYVKNDWDVTLRETWYGDASEMIDPVGNGKKFYKQWSPPGFVTDLDVSYYVTNIVKLTIGAENLFNKYPARVPTISTGSTNYQIYPAFSPYGFDGGYYYTKVTLSY